MKKYIDKDSFDIHNDFLYHSCGARLMKIHADTSIINGVVYCDKCKKEYIVNIVNGKLIQLMLK